MKIIRLGFYILGIYLSGNASSSAQVRKVYKLTGPAWHINFNDADYPDHDDLDASGCYIKTLIVKKGRFKGVNNNKISHIELFCEEAMIADSISRYIKAKVVSFRSHNAQIQESDIHAKLGVFSKFASLNFKFKGSKLICNGVGTKYKPDLGIISMLGAGHLADEPMHSHIRADEVIIVDGSGLKIDFKGKKMHIIDSIIDKPIVIHSGVLFLKNTKISAPIKFVSKKKGVIYIAKHSQMTKETLKKIEFYLHNCSIRPYKNTDKVPVV